MAFSWFSKKQSSEQVPKEGGQLSKVALEMRTMQSDLDAVAHGEKPAFLTQGISQKEKPQDTVLKQEENSSSNPFGKEVGKNEKPQKKESKNQSENPFGVVSTPPVVSKTDFSKRPTLDNGLKTVVPDGKLVVNSKKSNGMPLLISGIVIILLAAAGAYYFFMNKEKVLQWFSFSVATEDSIETPVETSSEDPLSVSEAVPPAQPPFSVNSPNYLSFNTETVSPGDIYIMLSQAAARIKAAELVTPIEFLVTDQNNNPLAFSRFALLSGIEFNPEILALFKESFSLYIYNDGGQPRLGLAVAFNDALVAVPSIKKIETELPFALRALILESDIAVAKKSLPFQSSEYNQYQIRYINTNNSRNVSLDYVLVNNQFFIGTSKNTLRAILDMSQKN